MSLPLIVTHSDIALFLRCKRSWYWSYVMDFNRPERLVGALALGSRVHAAIEGLYRAMQVGEPFDAVEAHQDFFEADLAIMELAGAPSWDIDQLYDDAIVGRNCVIGYVEWLAATGANHGFSVDGVEDKIEAEFLGGKVLLRGKIDLRLRRDSDGALILDDLKTTGLHFGTLRDQLEKSYQLRIYRIIQQLLTPTEPVAAVGYDMIKKVTRKQKGSVLVERFFVPGILNAEAAMTRHIEGICSDMLFTIDRVTAGENIDHVAYPSPGESCKWCEFKHPCTVADEAPAAAVEMLENQFTRGRHARYDETITRDE